MCNQNLPGLTGYLLAEAKSSLAEEKALDLDALTASWTYWWGSGTASRKLLNLVRKIQIARATCLVQSTACLIRKDSSRALGSAH
mmetsp:Transcript_33104/g.67616  ORF Transcript_33104/g.67616 Transcript_33104/m.67616 type:complete len:85 (-) Transcript_33104:107-361(-)